MIAISLDPKPSWYKNFIRHVFGDSGDGLLVYETKVWFHMVNNELLLWGGRYNRNYHKDYSYITFRLESNYTLFLLRFS